MGATDFEHMCNIKDHCVCGSKCAEQVLTLLGDTGSEIAIQSYRFYFYATGID